MPRALRICMLTTFYPPYNFGGDGIYVQRLCHELAERGHHVEVIHNADAYLTLAGREPPSTGDAVPGSSAGHHPGVTVHTLRSRSPFLSALAMQQSGTPALHAGRIRAILAQGFDVIHYHNVSLVGGPRVLQYGEGLKLYTTHEYWLVCPTHVLFRFNRQACTRRDCPLCQLLYKRPPQLWRYTPLLSSAASQVQAFLAPSRFAIDKHHEYGFDGAMVHLPHFAPRTELAATETGGQAEPYFLFVGRLEKLKGLQTVIPVFRRYRRAQLWIAGRGSYEPHLQRLAAGCDNIRFLGFVAEADLRALYRQAVAAIVPSLCYEIFSLVQLEAFRQQTPVIVRDLGSLPEVSVESGGGLCYDSEDELRQALDSLVSDRAYRDHLGQNGYQAYVQKWTPEVHLQHYLRLISQ